MNKNIDFEENLGIICSFIRSLTPSMIACNKPMNDTLFGPRRVCLRLNR